MADELRAYATGALDLLEPWINQVRDTPPRAGHNPTCTGCPLCALLAVLRGERSEMAVRVAEQASGLLAVLRAALAEGNGARTEGTGPRADGDGAKAGGSGADGGCRGVQRIPVSRADGGTASDPC
jgi:hypothetical protein